MPPTESKANLNYASPVGASTPYIWSRTRVHTDKVAERNKDFNRRCCGCFAGGSSCSHSHPARLGRSQRGSIHGGGHCRGHLNIEIFHKRKASGFQQQTFISLGTFFSDICGCHLHWQEIWVEMEYSGLRSIYLYGLGKGVWQEASLVGCGSRSGNRGGKRDDLHASLYAET